MSLVSSLPVLLAVAIFATAARGADAPCAADISRFCEGKTPVEVLSCLQTHQPDLADSCKQRIDLIVASLQTAAIDCEPDAFAFCRDAASGEPMVTCLGKHQGELTRRCQGVFDGFARREAANAKVCASDAGRFCPKAKAGKGDVHVCLMFHGKDVSTACREALTR
jgi:hypothetical protein